MFLPDPHNFHLRRNKASANHRRAIIRVFGNRDFANPHRFEKTNEAFPRYQRPPDGSHPRWQWLNNEKTRHPRFRETIHEIALQMIPCCVGKLPLLGLGVRGVDDGSRTFLAGRQNYSSSHHRKSLLLPLWGSPCSPSYDWLL